MFPKTDVDIAALETKALEKKALEKKLNGLGSTNQIENTISRIRTKKNWENFITDYTYGLCINPYIIKNIVEEYYSNKTSATISPHDSGFVPGEVASESLHKPPPAEANFYSRIQTMMGRPTKNDDYSNLGVERYTSLSGEQTPRSMAGGDVAILVDGVLEIHKRNSKRKSRRNRKSNKSRKKLKKSKRRR